MTRAERIDGQRAPDCIVRRKPRHADKQHRRERDTVDRPAARDDASNDVEYGAQNARCGRLAVAIPRRKVEAVSALIERERDV